MRETLAMPHLCRGGFLSSSYRWELWTCDKLRQSCMTYSSCTSMKYNPNCLLVSATCGGHHIVYFQELLPAMRPMAAWYFDRLDLSRAIAVSSWLRSPQPVSPAQAVHVIKTVMASKIIVIGCLHV
jgi:hypothetical protein